MLVLSDKFDSILRVTLSIITLLSTIISSAQFDKAVSFRSTAIFDFKVKGMFINDAAFGLGFDAAFFAKHKLMSIIETSAEKFVGDKLLAIDSVTGEHLTKAAILGVKAGAQFFLIKQLAVSATCGPTWHIARASDYSLDIGIKYCLTGFLGQKRKLVTKFFLVNIPADRRISYLGVALGWRF
jgi:hypothetical protein